MFSHFWSELRFRARALVQRNSVERDLADELRSHVEHETDKLVRAGLSAGEARRRAQLSFGGLERIKDDTRDARGLAWIDVAGQEIRYAARALRMRPGFTMAAVLTLALGIGANAAMFGVVDRLMFRPPAYLKEPDRVNVVYLASTFRREQILNHNLEFRRYHELAEWTSSLSRAAGFFVSSTGVGAEEASRERKVGVASASFFDFFSAQPIVGRFFTAPDDALPSGALVTVLSYEFWQVEYGGRHDVIGSKLPIGRGVYTIIGVAPRGFAGVAVGTTPVAWVPLTTYAALSRPNDFADTYGWEWLEVLVARKPGVSVATAMRDLTSAYRRSWLSERAMDPSLAPVDSAQPHAILAPTQVDRGPEAGPEARAMLLAGGIAFVVLLVACANVAGLLLARGFSRRREIAVRLALGVSRGRLLGHLVAESMMLAACGAIAGLLLARIAGGTLGAMFTKDAGPAAALFDARVLLFSAAITIAVGVVTALAPALQAGRADVLTDLRSGARDGGGRRSRLRTALVVFQGTLSVVLLVGAGLFLRSFMNVRSMRLGYDAERVLVVARNMQRVRATPDEARALQQRLLDAVVALPGVETATSAVSIPFYSHESTHLGVPGIDSVSRLGRFQMQIASPTYFATMGTRIIAGRGITTDDRKDAPRSIVVSETMARRLWPGRSAIGQCIHVMSDTLPCFTVVGIAEDIKERQLSHDTEANFYIAVDQVSRVPSSLFVRVGGTGAERGEVVRRALQAEMPAGSYVTVIPMADLVGDRERAWRVGAIMFVAFGVLALTLGAIGLYGVIAYGVEQRSRELGIRLALGAGTGGVVRLVIGEGVRLAAAGVAAGCLLALLGGRLISTLLFDEPTNDPVVFGVVGLALLVVAIAASAIPALRATRLDPNEALRAD